MLQRIREAMKGSGTMTKLGGSDGGPVEVDETFVSPNTRKMHSDKRLRLKKAEYAGSKAIVMGMLDRESRQVRAQVVPNVKHETLQNAILDQV